MSDRKHGILQNVRQMVSLGISQARWGLGIDRPALNRRVRRAYRNSFIWYDGDGSPAVDSPEVERYAYSEREHWEAVMDELGIEYDDIRAEHLGPDGDGDEDETP